LLALFDIDGTLLLTSDPIAGRALVKTLQERFDVELDDNPVPKVDHPGQSCQRIARLVLQAAGLSDDRIDAGLHAWCGAFGERYVELLADADTSGWQTGPGAADGLARLESAGVELALLTGNPERMARARMERLGLARFFPPGRGGFGCDGESRGELIAAALERSATEPSDTVAIGDTKRDVDSAHEAGLRAIVLHSPKHPDAHLGADAAFDSLDEVAARLLAWAG
jgi:phosphoglycolate phosphatase-like HAD superfamily hydrolase